MADPGGESGQQEAPQEPAQETPPAEASGGTLRATLTLDGKKISTGLQQIEYDHIPVQVVYPPAELRVERVDVRRERRARGQRGTQKFPSSHRRSPSM